MQTQKNNGIEGEVILSKNAKFWGRRGTLGFIPEQTDGKTSQINETMQNAVEGSCEDCANKGSGFASKCCHQHCFFCGKKFWASNKDQTHINANGHYGFVWICEDCAEQKADYEVSEQIEKTEMEVIQDDN